MYINFRICFNLPAPFHHISVSIVYFSLQSFAICIIVKMRESNVFSEFKNAACLLIQNDFYDRQALDCTSDAPLVFSLNELKEIIWEYPRVRKHLMTDGGLERLVSIMRECVNDEDYNRIKLKFKNKCNNWLMKNENNQGNCIDETKSIEGEDDNEEVLKLRHFLSWKWSLAFQCIQEVCTEGSDQDKEKVILAGLIPIIATILSNYLKISKEKGEKRMYLCFQSLSLFWFFFFFIFYL